MEIENSFIAGLKIIHLNKFVDNRGSFVKMYNEDFFIANNLRTDFKESYFSVSLKNVIRGMHFQTPPADHTKLVFVNRGSILDVVLDLRTDSTTYGKFYQTIVSENENKLVYIPEGCAHGFLSQVDETIVSYIQTSVHDKECDQGVRWDSFGMDWGVDKPIISRRDSEFLSLNEYKSPF